ncbi:MAG: rubrerythrin family protein [Candidatus Peribacteria bacterium]|jgi:rubrerythrin|nr:rubrerythrin family protein [Candidatus Peribacteria bacterium]
MNKTIECLVQAYLGEAQARDRYTFYASTAKKEGYEQIAEIFSTVAEQEKKHGKTFYEFLVKLCGEELTNKKLMMKNVDIEIPVVFGTTAENLKGAIQFEGEEFLNLYPHFADIAEQEGYPDIAAKFRAISHAEEHHKINFEKLLELVESGTYFNGRGIKTRVCRECGYMIVGESAPKICPSCDHPQGYFELLQNDF